MVTDAAARRQKWIDQSQSVNLWLKAPDLKVLSHMYRSAWHAGLKTTYYLRTLGASGIEKATVSAKKDVRGAAGETKEATTARDVRDAAASAGNSTPSVTTDITTTPFASVGTAVSNSAPAAAKKTYTADEKKACSIEAMRNGEECEACQ